MLSQISPSLTVYCLAQSAAKAATTTNEVESERAQVSKVKKHTGGAESSKDNNSKGLGWEHRNLNERQCKEWTRVAIEPMTRVNKEEFQPPFRPIYTSVFPHWQSIPLVILSQWRLTWQGAAVTVTSDATSYHDVASYVTWISWNPLDLES